jgi:Leucine Rich repeat
MEAERQRQQQQQQQPLHVAVVDGIARLSDPLYRAERQKVYVEELEIGRPVDRRSLQHLVDFLVNDVDDTTPRREAVITELFLDNVTLVSEPSPDGGLNVLKDLFARSDTTLTLTKVTLRHCDFGSQQNTEQLLAAFHTNRTITYLYIQRINNLRGSALGASLSGLMQSMPQLQRLYCTCRFLCVEGVRACQPALQENRTLKELDLSSCQLGDKGTRLIADALVGNTTLELLNISDNYITCTGLVEITRLIESTQLKTITFWQSGSIFSHLDATQHFVRTLQQKKSSLQELPWLKLTHFEYLPDNINSAAYASIKNSLTRNQQLNRVTLLVSPPPPLQQQQQHQKHAITNMMMLQISHRAIAHFATKVVPDCAGTSAIFKLFQARPALLEKRRLKRPITSTAAAAAAAVATVLQQEQQCNKRRRL